MLRGGCGPHCDGEVGRGGAGQGHRVRLQGALWTQCGAMAYWVRGRVLSEARPVPVYALAGPSAVCDGRTGQAESRGQRPRRKLEKGLGGKGGACARAGVAVWGGA